MSDQRDELRVENISVDVGGERLVRDVSFSICAGADGRAGAGGRSGELVCLLGPNGAGKTTLLRTILGFLAPAQGAASINGAPSAAMSAAARARAAAYLPQTRPLVWPSIVRDIVSLGRFAYGAAPDRLSPSDAAAVDRAIAACDLEALSARRADTLSGGELARVHCARAFAAETPLLVADEPVAALDPRHQHLVMQLIRNYVDNGAAALCVLHDAALAAQYADRLLWMKAGRLVADGSVRQTLTPAQLADVYGVKARFGTDGASVQITGPA